jgi:hypothetical protein
MQRFLVGRYDTSHLDDYPSSGIIRQAFSRPTAGFGTISKNVIGSDLRRPRSRAIMLGLVSSQGRVPLQLDATAEETMSPIARRPMPSSLLAAA